MKLTPEHALKLIADYVNIAGAVKPVAPIREVLQALDPALCSWPVGAQAITPTGHGIDKSLLRPDGDARDRRDHIPALEVITTATIETTGLTIRLDGDGYTDRLADKALALFRDVSADIAKQRRAEAIEAVLAPTEVRGGSVTGFVIEPAGESLHDRLPGGWVR